MKRLIKILYPILALASAMVGYHIHENVFYAIINFLFWPLAWAYWLITHSVNISIIKETFSFFLN